MENGDIKLMGGERQALSSKKSETFFVFFRAVLHKLNLFFKPLPKNHPPAKRQQNESFL